MKKIMLLLFFVITLQRLFASDFQVYIDSNETYVGQALQLTMQVRSNKAVERPELKNIPGFQISPTDESRYEQRSLGSGGGSRTVVMEYSWRLLPLQAGRLSIPAFEIELEDGVFSSSEIEILVREPGPIEGYHLFMSIQGDTVFPGIPVRLSLKWLFSSEVSRPEFSLPFLNQDNLKVLDLPPPSAQSSDIYQFKVEGRTVYAAQSAEIFEGEQYASLTMFWDLYPQEVGRLDLDSAFLSFQRTIINKQGRKTYAPSVIPSNELNLNVKELPRELKNFPGGILVADDTLGIDITLDQTRIYPGDPVQIALTFEGLSRPEITEFNGFSSFEELFGIVRVDKGSLMSEQQDNSKTYTQKIRIETDQLDVFPALNFPYYSLKKGTVETVVSHEIPLTMLSLEDSITETEAVSSGFLNWSHGGYPENEGQIELKGNHRIKASALNQFLYGRAGILSLLLFIANLFLLVCPLMLKGLSSIRFGKAEADIRIELKKAVEAYEGHPDQETGQKLYELLFQWKEIRNPGQDESIWFQDLTDTLEKTLWGDEKEEPLNNTRYIIKLIKDNLIKHLITRREFV